MFPPSLGTIPSPAWVLLLPFQLQCYYPLASVLLLFQVSQYYYPPSSLNSSSEGGIGHALVFEHSFAERSLSYVLRGSRPDGAVTLSRCYPPRFRDFLEELVVGDGVKNSRSAFTCSLQGRSAAHFRKHLF